jgi:hypothetical protein
MNPAPGRVLKLAGRVPVPVPSTIPFNTRNSRDRRYTRNPVVPIGRENDRQL